MVVLDSNWQQKLRGKLKISEEDLRTIPSDKGTQGQIRLEKSALKILSPLISEVPTDARGVFLGKTYYFELGFPAYFFCRHGVDFSLLSMLECGVGESLKRAYREGEDVAGGTPLFLIFRKPGDRVLMMVREKELPTCVENFFYMSASGFLVCTLKKFVEGVDVRRVR